MVLEANYVDLENVGRVRAVILDGSPYYVLRDVTDAIGISYYRGQKRIEEVAGHYEGGKGDQVPDDAIFTNYIILGRKDGNTQSVKTRLIRADMVQYCFEVKRRLEEKRRKKQKVEQVETEPVSQEDMPQAPTFGESIKPEVVQPEWTEAEEDQKPGEPAKIGEIPVETYMFAGYPLRRAMIDGVRWYSLDDVFVMTGVFKTRERLEILQSSGTQYVKDPGSDKAEAIYLVRWRGIREMAQEEIKRNEDAEFFKRFIKWLEWINMEEGKVEEPPQEEPEDPEPRDEEDLNENLADFENLIEFKNDQLGAIHVEVIDGQSWFLARDVARILGYSKVNRMLERLSLDEKRGTDTVPPPLAGQYMMVINESGLYNAIFGSRRPEAQAFRKWVTSEVLPAIRKYGMYATEEVTEMILKDPDFGIRILTQLKEERDKRENLQIELKEAQPKIDFYHQMGDSTSYFTFGEASKTLKLPLVGRNTLFRLLRERKILMVNNEPYERYISWFKVVQRPYLQNGEQKFSPKTLITGKGLQAIRELLKDVDGKGNAKKSQKRRKDEN